MSAKEIQEDLFSYLSTDLDIYDFGMFLNEFLGDDDEHQVEDLTDAQRLAFVKWLKDEEKPSQWLMEDPVMAPSYLMLHAREKLPEGTWLMHFSRKRFKFFEYGSPIAGLHLSTHLVKKAKVDCKRNLEDGLFGALFGFAFEPDYAYARGHWRDTFGDYVVLFQCDDAVLCDHDTDQDSHQVVFPLCSEYNEHSFSLEGGLLGELEDGEQILFDSPEDAIDYIENQSNPKLQGIL